VAPAFQPDCWQPGIGECRLAAVSEAQAAAARVVVATARTGHCLHIVTASPTASLFRVSASGWRVSRRCSPLPWPANLLRACPFRGGTGLGWRRRGLQRFCAGRRPWPAPLRCSELLGFGRLTCGSQLAPRFWSQKSCQKQQPAPMSAQEDLATKSATIWRCSGVSKDWYSIANA